MEYQSFFAILKKYEIKNNQINIIEPHIARGFLQVSKNGKNTIIVIKTQDKICAVVDLFCGLYHKQIKIDGNITNFTINDELDYQKMVVCIFSEKLVAGNCDIGVIKNYIIKNKNIVQENDKNNIFEKIFGNVPITYFYDSIKPKLSKLFALGKKCDVSNKFGEGDWVEFEFEGVTKIVGIIYSKKFPKVVAIGSENNRDTCYSNLICVDGKYFDTIFLSAEDGNFLQFCDGNWC